MATRSLEVTPLGLHHPYGTQGARVMGAPSSVSTDLLGTSRQRLSGMPGSLTKVVPTGWKKGASSGYFHGVESRVGEKLV